MEIALFSAWIYFPAHRPSSTLISPQQLGDDCGKVPFQTMNFLLLVEINYVKLLFNTVVRGENKKDAQFIGPE